MLLSKQSTGKTCLQMRFGASDAIVRRDAGESPRLSCSVLAFYFALCVIVAGCRDQGAPSAPVSGKAMPERTLRWEGRTMGTTYRVVVWADLTDGVADAFDQKLLEQNVEERLAQINQRMSTYQPDSELSRFNRAPSHDWFSVSPETAYVVEAAIGYHRATNGALDVTIGPLTRLWGFDDSTKVIQQRPTQEQVHEVLKRVGSQYLQVRIAEKDQAAIQKTVEGLEIDVSCLAKGFAVDQLVALLRQSGGAGGLVEIGGEVRTWGHRADDRMWRVGIENPMIEGRTLAQIVKLDNAALATSGDYRNFRSYRSGRVSHLIDPSTGMAQSTGPRSVSVCAKTCMESDALATALFLMGRKQGLAWSEDHGVAAMFLTIENGKLSKVYSSHFASYLE